MVLSCIKKFGFGVAVLMADENLRNQTHFGN